MTFKNYIYFLVNDTDRSSWTMVYDKKFNFATFSFFYAELSPENGSFHSSACRRSIALYSGKRPSRKVANNSGFKYFVVS